ncbi:MAG: hypothetical protein ABH856_04820 [Patescibacteria group bacterium]
MPTYEGPERRSTPRGAEITDNQAGGALKRIITEAEFTEDGAMRSKLRELFLPAEPDKPKTSTPASAERTAPQIFIQRTQLDAQARKYVEYLVRHAEYGYNLAHNEITDGGLYDPEEEGIVKAPTMEEAVVILQEQLSMEEIEAIKRYMRVPGLVMEPQNLPWQKFVANLDTGTKNKWGTVISDSRRIEFDRQDQSLGIQKTSRVTDWKVGIAEREKELGNNRGLLGDITAQWEKGEAAKLLQLPTQKLYALLQKGTLLSGDKKQLDRESWSVLQRADEPREGESRIICPDGLVSVGLCDWSDLVGRDRVNFGDYNPGNHCDNARLCPAVMKNPRWNFLQSARIPNSGE